MTDRIIDLLPSRDLKQKIRETNYQFSQAELLTIILEYAPTYQQRMELLDEFGKTAPPKLAKVAAYCAAKERELLRRFLEERDGFIYELHIRPELDKNMSVQSIWRFICDSNDTALAWIDKFYEEMGTLDIKETEESKYMIAKRKVLSSDDCFDDDEDSVCHLGPGKTLLRVEGIDLSESGQSCTGNCMTCGRICISWSVDVFYPCYASPFSIVRFRDSDVYFSAEAKEHLGICLCPEGCCPNQKTDTYYVIPMDCEPVRTHHFELAGNEHDHIPLPQAELIRAEDLDEEDRKNYDAFVQWWKDREKAEKTEDKN